MIPDGFANLGYVAVFLGTLLEGEAVLFLAGLAAHHGFLSLPGVIVIAVVGGFMADQFFFFLGRRYGNRMFARFPFLAERAPRVQALLKRWDVLAVVFVRFLYGLRIAGPIVIGSAGIPAWRLALFNLIGALIWAPVVAGIGYFAGQAVQQWLGRLEHEHVLALMAAALAVVFSWLAIEWRRRRS